MYFREITEPAVAQLPSKHRRWRIRPAPRPLAWFGIGGPLFVGLAREQPDNAQIAGAAIYCAELRDVLHVRVIDAMR